MLSDEQRPRVVAIRGKYAEILALRCAPKREQAPRAAMRGLASRFPGALRELDQRPLDDVRGRIADLEAALSGHAPLPAWFEPQDLYHRFLRAALRLRPQLRSGGRLDGPVASGELSAQELGEAWLSRIASPEGGRLNPVAIAFVSGRCGLHPAEVAELVS